MAVSRFPTESRQPAPFAWLVLALCAAYLVAGTTGHDPWKSEDAVGLAITHGFFSGNGWLVPGIAGEFWPDAEPLYHWLAAGTAALTQGFLPFHDGARLASALFGGLFLFLLAGTARSLYGPDASRGAPLLAIGTLGLLVPLHEAQPAAAVLAATAGVYWGSALLAERPLTGALMMGGGLGATFLAGGLGGLLPPLVLLAVPLMQRRWAALAVAISLAVAVGTSWPMLLGRHAPAFLDAWWGSELASILPHDAVSLGHAKLLGWFAWPVLFIAPWAIWRGRRQLATPGMALPLLGAMVALVWYLAHDAKPATLLPLMPPLILLAAAGTASLRRGAANAWDWFGMMTLSIAAALVWLGSVAMQSGWPPKIAHNFAKLEPGFVAHFSLPALLVALFATAAWFLALWRLPRSPWRVAIRWAAGITVVWVLLTTLWMPWIDYGKTYRPVVAELRQVLPADAGCIGRRGVGAPQRAALDYFAGIRTRAGSKGCQWLIAQGSQHDAAPAGWQKVWEGHRPGDRGEWLRLYRRSGVDVTASGSARGST